MNNLAINYLIAGCFLSLSPSLMRKLRDRIGLIDYLPADSNSFSRSRLLSDREELPIFTALFRSKNVER